MPNRFRTWMDYWKARLQIERQAVACLDDLPAVADVLMNFLEGHCFGCGVEVTADEEELCAGCRERRLWLCN